MEGRKDGGRVRSVGEYNFKRYLQLCIERTQYIGGVSMTLAL